MAARGSDSDEVMSEINVTPFVDIVLVLLIILMVTSTEIVRSALKVELPKAASGGESISTTLNIVLTKEGDMFLDGEAATEEVLVAAIAREKKANPAVQAVIAADKGIIYGKVVRVIDVVKSNGVTSFALNIDREEAAPKP